MDLENFDERSQEKEAAHASMKKTGVRRSPPHYLMQLSLVDIVVLLLHAVCPRFSQMEWQILLAMGITSVILSKSVFLMLPSYTSPSDLDALFCLFFSLKCVSWFIIFKALIALKKGTQLIKYSRKGRPKLCPFRISTVSNNFLVETQNIFIT